MWEEETRVRKQNFSSSARLGEEEEETMPPQNVSVSSFFFKRMKQRCFA
jgi:hypothetical protein